MKGGNVRALSAFFLLFFLAVPVFAGVEIENQNNSFIEGTVSFPEFKQVSVGGYTKLSFDMAGSYNEEAKPDIPILSTFVAIPTSTGGEVEILDADYEDIPINIDTWAPVPDDAGNLHRDEKFYSEFSTYPTSIAKTGNVGILREFRVLPVSFVGVQLIREKHIARVYKSIHFRIRLTGSASPVSDYVSESYIPLYRALIANYDIVSSTRLVRRGGYLIISKGVFIPYLDELIFWKEREGFPCTLFDLDEDVGAGTTPSKEEIREFIRSYYNEADIPPEFLLLVGDVQMGSYGSFPDYTYHSSYEEGDYASDHGYSTIVGDDYLPDISVGRLTVDTPSELRTVVAKIVGYESNPYMDDRYWFRRALSIGANCCGSPNPTSPRLVALWTRDLLLESGFTRVDTVTCIGTICSHDYTYISSLINEGLGVVSYRGWAGSQGWFYPSYQISDILSLANGWKLPIMACIVCGSGDFNSSTDPCFGEAWIRAGTPSNPKGGVAFYGSSDHDTHTKWNNPNSEGFFWGYLKEHLQYIGLCVDRAKMNIYLSFPNATEPGGAVEHYMNVYSLLGDPGLSVWSRTPVEMTANFPDTIPAGTNNISVHLSAYSSPLAGAYVTIYKPGILLETKKSDGSGNVSFSITTDELSPGDTIYLTATRRDFKPFLGEIILGAPVSVSFSSWEITPPVFTPGETHNVTLHFHTEETIPGTYILLHTTDDIISLPIDSVFIGEVSGNFDVGFSLDIAGRATLFDEALVQISLFSSAERIGEYAIEGNIISPYFVVDSVIDETGDGVFSPGEEVSFTVSLRNIGSVEATAPVAYIRTPRVWTERLDSAAHYPNIPPEGSATSSDPFTVQVHDWTISGIQERFILEVHSGGFFQTIPLEFYIGEVSPSTFAGPTEYGYFIYDDTDTGSGRAPEYLWLELDPEYGGWGATELTLEDDETEVVPLPFSFKYFGQTYDTVSICSNGWFSFGRTTRADFYNRNIPNPSSANAQVSVFWDDLRPTGGIFYRYDAPEGRFIIEWRCENVRGNLPEIFEAVLFDPDYVTTPTGDGEILLLYHTVNDTDYQNEYSTVGIESPDQESGFEYLYCRGYNPTSAPLTPGRAILFTTNPPEAYTSSIEENYSPPENLILSVYPNPFNNTARISFSTPEKTSLTIAAYSISGQLVSVLFEGNAKPGWHSITWETDRIPSGVYLIHLKAGTTTISRRVILVK